MHANKVIHRNLKLTNILLTEQFCMKITDKGLSKSLTTLSKLARTSCGTDITMAPEMLKGEKYSFAADIWSLGCILYDLYTSKFAFFATTKERLME